MNTSCLLSLLLTNQTFSPFVVCLLLLVIIKAPDFFLLLFSGQGCTSNYKSTEARPGLYNLCGIFVQCRFCVRAASENGLGSALWSGVLVFWALSLSFLFFSNKPKPFFTRKRMFHMHVRTWEPTHIINSSSRFSKKIFTLSTLSCCMFWFLSTLRTVFECWTLAHIQHNFSSSLSLHKHHSALFFFPLPTARCFIPVRWWLIRPVPLLPASCDLLLCIGEGIEEELCRSSAASCTASVLHLHKIDSGFLVKYTGQDWLSFHLQFDWIGLSWLSAGRIGRFFFLFPCGRCCHSLWRRGAAGNGTREGAEWFVFEVSAPHDRLLWEKGDGPMCLSAQHPQREREIIWCTPPFSSVHSFCVFAQRNHSDYSFLNCCSIFMCNYDHTLMMRFTEEDRVFVTESDDHSDEWF